MHAIAYFDALKKAFYGEDLTASIGTGRRHMPNEKLRMLMRSDCEITFGIQIFVATRGFKKVFNI